MLATGARRERCRAVLGVPTLALAARPIAARAAQRTRRSQSLSVSRPGPTGLPPTAAVPARYMNRMSRRNRGVLSAGTRGGWRPVSRTAIKALPAARRRVQRSKYSGPLLIIYRDAQAALKALYAVAVTQGGTSPRSRLGLLGTRSSTLTITPAGAISSAQSEACSACPPFPEMNTTSSSVCPLEPGPRRCAPGGGVPWVRAGAARPE